MIVVRSGSDCDQLTETHLRALVERRTEDLVSDGAEDLVVFLVVQEGDTCADLSAHLGFSPLVNRWSGVHFGDEHFAPSFEFVEEHECCFEMVFVLSDDGSGALVFVPKGIHLDAELLELCRQYAVPTQEPFS